MAAMTVTGIDEPFIDVDVAVADDGGTIYCGGKWRADESHPAVIIDAEGTFHSANVVWAYEGSSLRLLWQVELPCDRLFLTPDQTLMVLKKKQESATLSRADGSRQMVRPPPLDTCQYAVADQDGTYVATYKHEVRRLAPAQGWLKIPLFDPESFFGRFFTSDHLDSTWGAAVAVADDGDLVVHHANEGELAHLSRFDRHGHRKLHVASPLGHAPGDDTILVRGAGGVVWMRGRDGLWAVTREAVVAVSPFGEELTPGMLSRELGPRFVALPDGSLVLFGRWGAIARARTEGAKVTGVERVR
jgi:hypothetical protein